MTLTVIKNETAKPSYQVFSQKKSTKRQQFGLLKRGNVIFLPLRLNPDYDPDPAPAA